MKKRKLFVALLASACIAASMAGIAACTEGDGHDPALYGAYQTYCNSTENPKSYEEWIGDILAKLASGELQGPKGEVGPEGPEGPEGERGNAGMDGVGVKDVRIWKDADGKEYFEFEFTDGKLIRLPMDGVGDSIIIPPAEA